MQPAVAQDRCASIEPQPQPGWGICDLQADAAMNVAGMAAHLIDGREGRVLSGGVVATT